MEGAGKTKGSTVNICGGEKKQQKKGEENAFCQFMESSMSGHVENRTGLDIPCLGFKFWDKFM